MQKFLVDTGPLVALFDGSDPHHKKTSHYLKTFDGELITTLPVITEACHLLNFRIEAQILFLEWVENKAVTLESLTQNDFATIVELTKKYSDQPMDFADATLVVTAIKLEIDSILTYNKDFRVYKLPNKKSFKTPLLG